MSNQRQIIPPPPSPPPQPNAWVTRGAAAITIERNLVKYHILKMAKFEYFSIEYFLLNREEARE